jgi:flagellar motor switch protein FliG
MQHWGCGGRLTRIPCPPLLLNGPTFPGQSAAYPLMSHSGHEKAAIVLMSLGAEEAALLVQQLPPDEVARLGVAMAKVQRVDGQTQQRVVGEFLAVAAEAGGMCLGGLDRATQLIEQALGDRATEVVQQIKSQLNPQPLAALKSLPAEQLGRLLCEEHPQTITLVVSCLPPNLAAAVMAKLPPDIQLSVVQRLTELSEVTAEAMTDIEQALLEKAAAGGASAGAPAGLPKVAEILTVSDRSFEQTLMERLGRESPEMVEQIRKLMFLFDDLVKLEDKEIQLLLRHVDNGQWALALKLASEPLQEKIFSNMSADASQTLKEEMSFMTKVRRADVEACQQRIMEKVRTLEASGELTRPGQGQEDAFVS